MISSLISRYMIDKVITQKTPSVKKRKCINKVQRKQKCAMCKVLCKNEAISLEHGITIDESKCTNCTICAGVCPTGTIVPTLDVIEKQYNSVINLEHVSISCEKEAQHSDLKVECLAILPWEFFAYLALDKKVYILNHQCETCNEVRLCEHFKKVLRRLEVFLGNELYSEKIHFLNKEEHVAPRVYDRRELFKLFVEESKRAMTQVSPIKLEENKNARIYRSLLVKKIRGIKERDLEDTRKFGWNGLKVNSNCYGCGVCATICPQGAITIKEDENKTRKFVHNYARCTHCGLCSTVCLEKAIKNTIISEDAMDLLKEVEISSLSCSVCKMPIKAEEGEVCIICQRRENS